MHVNLRFHLVEDIKLGKMKENVLAAELLQLDDKGDSTSMESFKSTEPSDGRSNTSMEGLNEEMRK